MILERQFFQTFTDLPIGDRSLNPSVSVALFLDSREAVDAADPDGNRVGVLRGPGDLLDRFASTVHLGA